jgi:hypothetical protein
VPYRPLNPVERRIAIGLLLHLSEKVTSQTCFTCCIRTAPQLLGNVLPQPERGATNCLVQKLAMNFDQRSSDFRRELDSEIVAS